MHPRSLLLSAPLLAVAAVFGACGQGSDVLTTTTSSAALATAQCTAGRFTAQVTACFTTFDACRSAEGADLSACRAALEACLPKPPHGPPGKGGGGSRGCDADGGVRDGHRGPGGHGGPRPGEGAGGLAPRDGDGGFGPPPRGGRGPTPDSAAITACHDALKACLDTTTDSAGCFATERTCARTAFDAAFAAACADAQAGCAASGADATECLEISQRCTEGAHGRPGASDGGVCE